MPSRQTSEDIALNVHIGARIRTQRVARGMSQTLLAQAVGVSFQQVQKYENGTNRISARRLQQIADALQINPALLLPHCDREDRDATTDQLLAGRGAMPLLVAFNRLPTGARSIIIKLVQHLGETAWQRPRRRHVSKSISR